LPYPEAGRRSKSRHDGWLWFGRSEMRGPHHDNAASERWRHDLGSPSASVSSILALKRVERKEWKERPRSEVIVAEQGQAAASRNSVPTGLAAGLERIGTDLAIGNFNPRLQALCWTAPEVIGLEQLTRLDGQDTLKESRIMAASTSSVSYSGTAFPSRRRRSGCLAMGRRPWTRRYKVPKGRRRKDRGFNPWTTATLHSPSPGRDAGIPPPALAGLQPRGNACALSGLGVSGEIWTWG
jgi:hypothetical protein